MPENPTPLSLPELAKLSVPDFENMTKMPLRAWHKQCHAVSLAAVQSGMLPAGSRVARGTVPGLSSQHSWVVLGEDCYNPTTQILDLTLWSYLPQAPVIYLGNRQRWQHTPHGSGNIFMVDMPQAGSGPVVELTPEKALSKDALDFLTTLGPLDIRGWRDLAHLPVEGWPSREIITAMHQTPALKAFIPLDIVGMVTDINPNGLYR